MTTASRRTFLAGAGTAAAAATAVTVAPAAVAHASPDASNTSGRLAFGAALVAYVQDVASGNLTLLTGEDESVVHDPDLVERLTQAARR